jgi:hypothetical protein
MAIYSQTAISPVRGGSVFKSGFALVGCVALARLVLYAFAGSNYGYFRDELYFLACGEHPAWGYVDQPPMIGWVAWFLQHTIGTSLWALHLLPALADVATIFLAALLVRELGGRCWAMFLASLAVLMAPIFLGLSQLFTMNAFDPPLWTAMALVLVRVAQQNRQREWITFGTLAGITILNKYGVLFWLSGVLVGILLTRLRQSLRSRWFWIGCAIACGIPLPNFLWQWRYQFPFLQLMHNIRQTGRDIHLPPLQFLNAQAQMLGYFTALLALFALLFYFSSRGKPIRALGWAYLVFLSEMMILHGKMYYVAPVYPMLFAAGATWMESAAMRRAWSWSRPALALSIFAVCGLYAPTILPVFSVRQFLLYEHRLGIEQQRFENGPQGALPQIYADMFGWEEMTARVAQYYRTLSPEEQQNTAIFAHNYGEAGAIDFFGPKYGLPKAIGGHQTYWIWGPRDYTGESIIVLGEENERNLQTMCASYFIIGSGYNLLSRPEEWLPIIHCRGFKLNLQTYWPHVKQWN